MWITKQKYKALMHQIEDISNKLQEVENKLNHKVDKTTLTNATTLGYGPADQFNHLGMNFLNYTQKTIPHNEVFNLILTHLKLNIAVTDAVESKTVLTKTKPPKKETK